MWDKIVNIKGFLLDFDGTHQMLREAQGMTKDLTEVTETGAEREKDIKPLQLACGDNHV